VTVPDVDATTTLTVLNPGSDPVTAAVLSAVDVDRRVGPTSEPELAVAPGQVKTLQLPQRGARTVPVVITADHPIVIGYTTLGAAGAAASVAIPDLHHGG
jgi:hypothetical protein